MSALKKITSKAKILYKTGKYAKWTDAIKEASKSLHKTASTTVKKYGTKAKKYAVKKAKSGVKSLAKKVYESKYLAGAKKKPVKKTATKLHKDTKSHNVNIKVVSGMAGANIYGIVTGTKYSKLAQQLIIDNIDGSDYGKKLYTELEKIKFLKETFLSEYGWAVSKIGLQNSVESWLRGLPSSITLPFENYEIIKLAKNWGTLPKNATEKQEDKVLNNYWKLMAANIVKLFRKIK